MGFLGIDWANLFQNYNWSHIFAVWAMFLGTWAMVKYTENFRGVFPNWDTSDRIQRTEHVMALFALFANLGKIHLDWFYISGTKKMRMMGSIITTFVAFTTFGVFMSMAAYRQNQATNDKDTNTHGFWFGWIAFVFHFLSFVFTFFIPKDGQLTINKS